MGINILIVQTNGWTYSKVKSILNNRTTKILGFFKRIIKSVILTQLSNSKMYTDYPTSMWDSIQNLKFIRLIYFKFLKINL